MKGSAFCVGGLDIFIANIFLMLAHKNSNQTDYILMSAKNLCFNSYFFSLY